MAKGKRFSILLLLGLALVVTGLVAIQGNGPSQYAFLPGTENAAGVAESLEKVRDKLEGAASRVTLHGFRRSVTLSAGTKAKNGVTLYQAGPNWHEAYPRPFVSGRPVSQADIDDGSRVIVLDRDTAFLLFGDAPAEGQKVTLEDNTYTVAGVAENSRRLSETGIPSAWVPLGQGGKSDMMVLSCFAGSDSGSQTLVREAAEEIFGAGTLICPEKERTRETMIPRLVAIILAVWLLLRWCRFLGTLWRKQAGRIRDKSRSQYALKTSLYGLKALAPVILLSILTIGAGYLLAVFAIEPASILPEWVPESLGDFSKWGSRFRSLMAEAANPVQLQTAELAEIRFGGLLVRIGTALSLTGALLLCLGKKRGKGRAEGTGVEQLSSDSNSGIINRI